MSWDFEALRRALAGEVAPALVVSLPDLDANVARFRAVAEASGKKIRLATKSVRVPGLVRRILEQGGAAFSGLMCYSAPEAALLAGEGHDDLLVAYPPAHAMDFEAVAILAERGKLVVSALDCDAHADAWESFLHGRSAPKIRICIDVDVSYRPAGLHLGVRRSPILNLEGVMLLVARLRKSSHLELDGILAYEAQVAGVGDRSPTARLMKSMSIPDVRRRRLALAERLRADGVRIRFFNGGGSGCLQAAADDPALTEVGAGSGLLQSHLFDGYRANLSTPAAAIVLRVTRLPARGFATCQSGGFIASGAPGPDKAPVVFDPSGWHPLSAEGFGEVQTPLECKGGRDLRIGDLVFLRPAKAGEIAERFTECLLWDGEKICGRLPTYRGLGHAFY